MHMYVCQSTGRCLETQVFPERILHFCDRADPRVAANINQPCAVSAKQRRINAKVLDFPRVEVTPEENARRVMVEATRLASLAPGEWRLWIDRSAERLRIPRAILEDVIAAIMMTLTDNFSASSDRAAAPGDTRPNFRMRSG